MECNSYEMKEVELGKVSTTMERISLSLSIIAILLAFTSFYYQFFYVSEEIKATVLDYKIENNSISTDIALINSGNRQALIKNIITVQARTGSNGDFYNGIGSVEPPQRIPTIIKPGEIMIITVTTPINAEYVSNFSEPMESSNSNDMRRVRIGFSFSAMDSKGTQFDSTSPFFELHFNKGEFRDGEYKPKVIYVLKS